MKLIRLQPCYKVEANPECHGTVKIRIQEADVSHSRHRCSGCCLVCLLGSQCNWTMLGTGKDCGWLPLQLYAELLRERVCRAVIFWYELTRCYTVSQFLRRAKPAVWKIWKTFLEVTDNFIKLSKLIKTWKIQVSLWITKASSSQYGQNYQKHHKHAKNWNTALCRGLCQGQLYKQKIQPSVHWYMPLPRTVLKLDLFTVYIWWLPLYCKLTKHHPLAIWDSPNFSKLIFLKIYYNWYWISYNADLVLGFLTLCVAETFCFTWRPYKRKLYWIFSKTLPPDLLKTILVIVYTVLINTEDSCAFKNWSILLLGQCED